MTATSEIVDGLVCSTVFCDAGPSKMPEDSSELQQHTIFSTGPGETIYAMRQRLKKEGWTRNKAGDYCPHCTAVRQGRKDAIEMWRATRARQARLEIYVGDLLNDARGG